MTRGDVPLALARSGRARETDARPAAAVTHPLAAHEAEYPRAAPDVAAEALALHEAAIDWVGMQGIDMPILFDAGDGNLQRCHARVDAFVNLVRPDRRGIHMSRLYLSADQRLGAEPVGPAMLESLLRDFLQSHHELADRARVGIHFEYLVRRKALRSQFHGWRAYPVCIEAALIGNAFHLDLATQVVYSSTCPASAALSRQLVQQQFAADFPAGQPMDHATVVAWLGSGCGMIATPHAQRSIARVQVRLAREAPLNLAGLLERVERSLRTAVQTAVKREDEQAFALINGKNPMFCEDAARRIRRALDADAGIAAYQLHVEHQESLHPHDAVAELRRNWPGPAHASGVGHGFSL